MRISVGSDATVSSPAFVGPDGETPTATTGVPVVSVTRANGTVLTAPVAVAVTGNDGVYTTVLTAAVHTMILERLTVTWTGTAGGRVQTYSTTVEVVGGHYATVPELRAMPGLDSTGDYPTATLVRARDEFADIVEDYRGVSYVPRYQYETMKEAYGYPYGRGGRVYLPHVRIRNIRSVSLAGVAVTDLTTVAFTLAGDLDWSYATATVPVSVTGIPKDIIVGYEHGYDSPPEPLRRACAQYVRAVLLSDTSGVSRDVVYQSMDGMTTRYSSPDKAAGRPTGFIEVDRLLNSVVDERVPAIA